MRAFLLAAVVILAGCATTNTEQSLQISCRAYDATLRTLAGYRAAGRLDADEIATVDRWRPVLNAACTGEQAGGDILDQVEAGLFELIAIEESNQ